MACGKWIEQRIFSFNLPNIVKINECQYEMSTAPLKDPVKANGRAGSSCNIINNLFSGHIFIPHAIITLSLSLHTSERPHAWLYTRPMMCKSKARAEKKHVMKLTEEKWGWIYETDLSHVDYNTRARKKKMRRKQEEEAIVVHWCGWAHGFF